MKRQRYPKGTVMLGSRPAAGRWLPIVSCTRCRQLLKVLGFDSRGRQLTVFQKREWAPVRVLLRPTDLDGETNQTFAESAKSGRGHECFDAVEVDAWFREMAAKWRRVNAIEGLTDKEINDELDAVQDAPPISDDRIEAMVGYVGIRPYVQNRFINKGFRS